MACSIITSLPDTVLTFPPLLVTEGLGSQAASPWSVHRVTIVRGWTGVGETRAAGQGVGHTMAVAHCI